MQGGSNKTWHVKTVKEQTNRAMLGERYGAHVGGGEREDVMKERMKTFAAKSLSEDSGVRFVRAGRNSRGRFVWSHLWKAGRHTHARRHVSEPHPQTTDLHEACPDTTQRTHCMHTACMSHVQLKLSLWHQLFNLVTTLVLLAYSDRGAHTRTHPRPPFHS